LSNDVGACASLAVVVLRELGKPVGPRVERNRGRLFEVLEEGAMLGGYCGRSEPFQ
jgi:hypothetical protein